MDGHQWPGKIRLIGFIDAFFVISYSADNSFERGIVVYSGCPRRSICRQARDTNALAEEKDTIDSILADIKDKGTDERKSDCRADTHILY